MIKLIICPKLMKVRTQQVEATCPKPYLEYFASIHLKAYFTNNDNVTSTLPMYIGCDGITQAQLAAGTASLTEPLMKIFNK